MSVQFCKSGNVCIGEMYDGIGGNILNGTRYTKENPYVLSGKSNDICVATNNYAKVVPGATYYLMAQCDSIQSPNHGYSTATAGKATIWLYLSATYNPNSMGYDNPVCFKSESMIANGVQKYTIPVGINMARIRVNTYSNGTDNVIIKFQGINLIPVNAYLGPDSNSSLRISDSSIAMDNFIEN